MVFYAINENLIKYRDKNIFQESKNKILISLVLVGIN